MHGHKAFFAGVSTPNTAGSVHVVSYPFEEERKV